MKKRRAWPWLLLGAVLVVAANTRWPIGILGWVAPLPLLRYLRLTHGRRARLLLVLVLPVAYTLAVVKIATGPMPLAAALVFGVPIGSIFVVPYLAWDRLRALRDDWRAALAFPSLMVAVEWAQARFTRLGSWGSVVYTQLDDLPVLQMASWFGMAGVAFVVYGTAAAIDRAIAGLPFERRRWVVLAACLVLGSHALGSLRLAAGMRPERTVRAAAVGTDATFTGLPLPPDDELRRIDDALFDRTRAAATAGARLVVWNEAATIVTRDREQELLRRASDVAAAASTELVVAYVVPISTTPLLFENKYAWIGQNGSIEHVYFKHQPVPGEPAVRGTEPLWTVQTAFGRAAGALCYDYDFPYIARRQARLGADVVALPSSDWRGIDPIHGQMAAVRAIEGGFSILRSTRMGLSAGIDPHGRIRAWSSSWESPDRIMYVTLPSSAIGTVYARIGDLLVYVSIAFIAFAVSSIVGEHRRHEREP